MEESKIILCSGDGAFHERIERCLALWQESYCVRCVPARIRWDEFPFETHSAICFLDLSDAPVDDGAELESFSQQAGAVVAVFSNETQAIQAYRWHPAASLRFDFGYAEFCDAMDQCFSFWRQGMQWLELPFHRELLRLPLCRLRYAEANGRETLLYGAEGVMRASISLGKTAEELPSPPFLRCQKSFVVHTGAIRELSGGNVVMSDGREIPMARERVRELTNAVLAWNAARKTKVNVK